MSRGIKFHFEGEGESFSVVVDFVGDATTPIYRYRVYTKRKYWFDKRVFTHTRHREDIVKHKEECKNAIRKYLEARSKWE